MSQKEFSCRTRNVSVALKNMAKEILLPEAQTSKYSCAKNAWIVLNKQKSFENQTVRGNEL